VVWDTSSGKRLRQLDLGADHHKDVAVSPDGRWVLTGHEDRTVRLRDLRTGEGLHSFEMAGINVPRGLSFSADGRYAVAGSHRSWVYLWQLED
jgi:WD40 repeat protein